MVDGNFSAASKGVRLPWLGLYVFGGFALGPRVVRVRENQALRERWMRIEPESDDGRRIGIGQADFSHDLEGVRGNFRRIRDDAVNHFQAVDVGGVLLRAAER